MRRIPWLLVVLALCVRALVSLRTVLPGRDGATYLWMAEQCAHGAPSALFETVFHPLYPALVGALLWSCPWLDGMVAGQLVACGLGAAALLPLFAVTERLCGRPAAVGAGLAYAVGAWFARHPAECMSEGPFYLCVAGWAAALFAGRPRTVGLLAGLAFLLRPEGAALLVAAVVFELANSRRRACAWILVTALPLVALLPLGFWLAGAGFTLTPKAAFNYEVGIGHAAAPLRHYVEEAAKLPLAAGEEFGWLWLPLIVGGVLAHRPRLPLRALLAAPAFALLLPLLLQCAVVPMLHSHWRFLSGFGVLVLPFGGAAAAACWQAARRRHRALPWLFAALLAASEVQVVVERNPDFAHERELGRYLGARLAAGEFVVSDMPRLDYFAGQKPPPPRPLDPPWLLERIRQPECRFVALLEGRTAIADAEVLDLGLEPMATPSILLGDDGRRGVRLFERTRSR